MKETIKNISEIQEKLLNNFFHDYLNDQESYEERISLFVKDLSLTPIETDGINKFALIIIDSRNGEVINNDLRFNKLVIEDDIFHFIYINSEKTNKHIKFTFEINK